MSPIEYAEVKTKNREIKQMRMDVHLAEEDIRAYRSLVEEFIDVFAWSYEELKSILLEVVEHRIPLVPGDKPIRQKKMRMNPQLHLLVKADLERLL